VVAVETQREQAAAAMRRDYLSRQHHHIAAFVLWGVAVTLAVTHFLEHLNLFQVMSSGLQDLLIGWPMAIVLALVAAIVWGRD
jgi:cation transport ATPase